MISIYSILSISLIHILILVIGHHISRCLLQLSFQSPIKYLMTLQRYFVLLSFSTHQENSLKRPLERDYNINPFLLTSFILINWVDLNSTQLLIQVLSSLILFVYVGSRVFKQVYQSLILPNFPSAHSLTSFFDSEQSWF